MDERYRSMNDSRLKRRQSRDFIHFANACALITIDIQRHTPFPGGLKGGNEGVGVQTDLSWSKSKRKPRGFVEIRREKKNFSPFLRNLENQN